ncbi:MAG: tRNA (guanine(10)-N(2))-dimethyltransferase [Promethearchaeota archaeon]
MTIEIPLREIKEGKATIDVPDLEKIPGIDSIPRKKQPIFYNPTQILNRDFSVLLLAILYSESSDLTICEPTCGTGIRGIRYALEIGENNEILMNDLNPLATKLTKHNLQKNNQEITNQGCTTNVTTEDAIYLFSKHRNEKQFFDVIDIDPFGSPARYFSSGILALKREGIICFTATDMPVLTGVYPYKAYKRYGIVNIYRTPFCHEVALRVLIASIQREGLRYSIPLKPILNFSADHYVRLFFRGKRISINEILENSGYIGICPKCNSYQVVSLNQFSKRCECRSIIPLIGPLWTGQLHETYLIEKMQEKITEFSELKTKKRLIKFLNLFKEENSVSLPYHYDIHNESKKIHIVAPGTEQLQLKLEERGWLAAKTHFSGIGIKTSAPFAEFIRILEEIGSR